jgi:hypothetical protein
VIIYDTLRGLFPAEKMTSNKIIPLTLTMFMEYILIPHTGVLLIAQDLGLSLADAHKVMLDSATYGKMRYPEDDEDTELENILAKNQSMFARNGPFHSV